VISFAVTLLKTTLVLSVTGCVVGDVGAPPGGGGSPIDASPGEADAPVIPDGAIAAVCTDRGSPGLPHIHNTGGTSNKGQSCMSAACHAAGGQGGTFTAAGTVYRADSTTANAGAVVRIKFGTTTRLAVTDTDGNFSFSQPITFPVTVDTTACPDTTPMVGSPAVGNCNSAGCHDAANRINFQ
jgi:hypothetical protein